MLTAFSRAFAQMTDPAFRGVLWRALALTAGLLAALGLAAKWAIGLIPATGYGWLDSIIDILAGAGAVLGLAVLLLPVASLFAGLFLDEVADAVERRHYPTGIPARPQGIVEGLLTGLTFLGAMVLLNLLVLPVYVIFAPLAPVLFYLVNGWLVGREFFELAALRHGSPAEAKALRLRHRGRVLTAGVALAFLLTIPVLNLIIPLFATAVMVHVYWSVAPGQAHASNAR
ncbi:EI24 domain-containing protein [Futiania mangrovi]|uniref:EI24 domain-containing protein n=1 Tax=Futiania mangrovi TaxID=2959716 RepID=A0A9J6PF68_9PROT|nr:EI24 domain-containing protein [Futiania mangrovii]MCP1336472.1 EI24 domain-containing protein [Futiania mangrovii]